MNLCFSSGVNIKPKKLAQMPIITVLILEDRLQK